MARRTSRAMIGSSSPVATFKGRAMSKITVSRAEAADALSVDIHTIDNMIADGRLRASKLGRRVVIRILDIEKMLTACEVAA